METIAIKLPDVVSAALLVICGGYGNGEERVKKLAAEGYDAKKVQRAVNDLLPIIRRYGGG